MGLKEKIKSSPYLVMKFAKNYFLGADSFDHLQILIKIRGQRDNLMLISKFMYIGNSKNIMYTDEKNVRLVFKNIMPRFGQVKILYPDNRTIKFPDYDSFINTIVSH